MSTQTETITTRRSRFMTDGATLLRRALQADAAITAANGGAYLVAAGPLGDLFDMPAGALRGIGAFLLVFALGVAAVARSPRPARAVVLAIVVANAVWAVDSVGAAVFGAWSPSTVGTIWIVMQAAVVALFAELQLTGLRRR
jgi:hypothetical protein